MTSDGREVFLLEIRKILRRDHLDDITDRQIEKIVDITLKRCAELARGTAPMGFQSGHKLSPIAEVCFRISDRIEGLLG